MKRTACLYRVSTKKQIDKDDDIPMQKIECRNFAQNMGWQIVEEYYEKGVSGYKLSSKQRDVIQQIKEDAKNKRFDVLLVFMFDRLGRQESDTPFLMQDFYKLGIELWSVEEGEQKFDTHVDKLMNYIRFWQSSGESEKTSIRVATKHKQMVNEGIYRGGKYPFGYKIVESDRLNKKGEKTSDLAINENEAKIVREIYSLVYNKGFGTMRIQNYLLEKGYKTSSGKKWSRASIHNLLSNPIYAGRFTFGKNVDNIRQEKELWNISEVKRDDLVIINENIWNRVQEIRTNKSPLNRKNEDFKLIGTSSPLLLIGFIKCGHCNNKIATTYNYSRWTRKNGEKCVTKKAIYRCNGRIDKRVNCDGQTTYNRNKIEGIVEEETFKYIDELKNVDLYKEIKKFEKENIRNIEKKINNLKSQKEDLYKELKLLNDEVIKILKGESNFTPEMINEIKDEKEKELIEIQEEIDDINIIEKQKKLNLDDIKYMNKYVMDFKEIYDNADIDEKRMMLSKVIDIIYVYRDKIDITFKAHLKKITDNYDSVYVSDGRAIDS